MVEDEDDGTGLVVVGEEEDGDLVEEGVLSLEEEEGMVWLELCIVAGVVLSGCLDDRSCKVCVCRRCKIHW